MSVRALNRATLGRQLLLRRESVDVPQAVRRLVALQAQHPASPYLALWNRLSPFDPRLLDDAFTAREVVKGNVPRMTLHAVHVEDYRAFREALEPSLHGAKLGPRFTVSGLTAADADALVPPLLDHAEQPRTAAGCEAWLRERLGAAATPGAWWGLRQYAPLWRAPTAAPWSFDSRLSYVAPVPRPVLADADAAAAGLRTLAHRYLLAFGPASVADLALFAQVQRSRARTAVLALGDALEQLQGPDGSVLYDVPGAVRPAEDTPAPPRLLGMWDNVLLAHVDRGRVIPPGYRAHVTRSNGDVLPTLLVDGFVAGVWRAVDGGIEATAFHRLTDETWQALAAEARSLLSLLTGRDPAVYRRYDHWWTSLPRAEVRMLRGEAQT